MLFPLFTLIVVFLLPGINTETQIFENLKDLFEATAENDLKQIRKLEDTLHEHQRREKELFDTFKLENRERSNRNYRNATIRIKKESSDNSVFNENKLRRDLEIEIETMTTDNKIKRITNKIVSAEKEIFRLKGLIRGIRIENNIRGKPLQMLGLRSVFETLVDELYPGQRPFNVGIYKAFNDILFSNSPKFAKRERIIAFRRTIDDVYQNTTRKECLENGGDIYKLFSGSAAHKLRGIVPFPSRYDINGIEEMYKSFGIIPVTSKVIFVQILLDESSYYTLPTDPTSSTLPSKTNP